MRGLRFRIAAALIALAMPVAAATPAAAGGDEWPRLTCLSGAIDSSTFTQTAEGSVVTLEGHLDCARPPKTKYYYGIASYLPGEKGVASLSQYMSPDPPTDFTLTGLVSQTAPAEIGVCVVTDYTVRIACVRVLVGQAGTVYDVSPLAVDAPLVNVIVGRITSYDGSLPGGTCATCW